MERIVGRPRDGGVAVAVELPRAQYAEAAHTLHTKEVAAIAEQRVLEDARLDAVGVEAGGGGARRGTDHPKRAIQTRLRERSVSEPDVARFEDVELHDLARSSGSSTKSGKDGTPAGPEEDGDEAAGISAEARGRSRGCTFARARPRGRSRPADRRHQKARPYGTRDT